MSTAYRVVLNVVVYVEAEDEDAAENLAYMAARGVGVGECDWDTADVEEWEEE